jgi:hypothetical protein
MSKKRFPKRVRKIAIDPNPKGDMKALGGAKNDDWNIWLGSATAAALPVNQNDEASAARATVAAYSGMIDMKPDDPVEGILVSQIMAANQASLSMYRRAWAQPPEYFEARLKYLALADKAARTVAILTERLDHHRGRGQQHITVKHITVNADQAVVTEHLVAAKPETAALNAISEKPMQMIADESNIQLAGDKDEK